MDDKVYNLLIQALYLIPLILLFVGSFYYLIRKGNLAGFLLLGGSGFNILLNLIRPLLDKYFLQKRMETDLEPMKAIQKFYLAYGFFDMVATLLFAVGFFLLIRDALKAPKS